MKSLRRESRARPSVKVTAGRLHSYRVLSLQRPHKVPGMPDIQVISAIHAFVFATQFNGAGTMR